MNTITLNYSNEKDLELLLQLAERIGIFPAQKKENSTNKSKESTVNFDSVENKDTTKDLKTVVNNLTKIKSFSEIKDPLEWQRELRKDRKLF